MCAFQMMLNPLGISLDPARSRLQMTTDITRQIYLRDGVRGFYRGYIASLCTYVPNSALWWAFYDLYQGKYKSLMKKVRVNMNLVYNSVYDTITL
jgi:solute carrier family 25 protein 44